MKPSKHFSYESDIVLLAPSARGLNSMLAIYAEFAIANMEEFSSSNTVVFLHLLRRYHVNVSHTSTVVYSTVWISLNTWAISLQQISR